MKTDRHSQEQVCHKMINYVIYVVHFPPHNISFHFFKILNMHKCYKCAWKIFAIVFNNNHSGTQTRPVINSQYIILSQKNDWKNAHVFTLKAKNLWIDANARQSQLREILWPSIFIIFIYLIKVLFALMIHSSQNAQCLNWQKK